MFQVLSCENDSGTGEHYMVVEPDIVCYEYVCSGMRFDLSAHRW